MNTVIGDSIDSVTALNQKQAELLDELQNLHESIGSDSTLSELISEKSLLCNSRMLLFRNFWTL